MLKPPQQRKGKTVTQSRVPTSPAPSAPTRLQFCCHHMDTFVTCATPSGHPLQQMIAGGIDDFEHFEIEVVRLATKIPKNGFPLQPLHRFEQAVATTVNSLQRKASLTHVVQGKRDACARHPHRPGNYLPRMEFVIA